ncbi:MAG: AcrB/AcrD/AcrF family protein [Bryobacteraceae bacterium]
MIPDTYTSTLALTILSMLCWGSWANTTKLAKGCRFELFYFDYAIAVFAAATIAALSFGMVDVNVPGYQGQQLLFLDNLQSTSKTNIAYALLGGGVFNLANMLLVAAIAVAGMAIAFPIAIGLALIGGVVLNYIIHPAGNAALLFTGVGFVLLAIIVSAMAHAAYKRVAAPGPAAPGPRTASKPVLNRPRVSPFKGIALSLASGILMAGFYPLVELSKGGAVEYSLSPYTAAFCFGVGVLLTTPVYSILFMKVPVEGDEVRFADYFKLRRSYHLWGLLGGLIWTVGTISNFVAASAPAHVNVGPAISYALGQGATLISALWGLLVWREFKGAKPAVVGRLVAMLVLYVIGLTLISLAPLHGG